MLGFLKKKLKDSIKKFSKKVESEEKAKPVPKAKEKKPAKPVKPEPKKKIKKPLEIIEKEIEHIKEEQEGVLEEQETEEIAEELPEQEVESIQEPVVKPAKLEQEEEIEEELHVEKPKIGLRQRLFKKITQRKIEAADLDGFFEEMEPDLLQANIAFEVIQFLKDQLRKSLEGREIKRSHVEDEITKALEIGLLKTVDQGRVDIEAVIKKCKSNNRPAVVVVIGFNGAGKTTSIAKLANYLKNKNYKPVLAAGDTWRAAAQEQLEYHGEKIGVKVIKHQYGADSAAVVFDAVKHAEAKGLDIVIADTAGRTHTNTNLMDELKKVCRVNKPDLKVLVVDSLTGNDAVEQAKTFDAEIGIDAVVLTKVDVNERGGAILSVAYAVKKPILFLGMGQKYEEFEQFDAQKFVKSLVE
ncbi:MAG: signal recognition particle-docking protein FtsY [Candidatus Aenigmarchaeota archaeon]|nr:signal recognition particle-docking protein FtsY [Candidatus Aenigmarchaeota archaeon]